MVRATGKATAGPSGGVGVVVEAIRPKLVPVHISPVRFDLGDGGAAEWRGGRGLG